MTVYALARSGALRAVVSKTQESGGLTDSATKTLRTLYKAISGRKATDD
jgi:hypothetical protein